MLDALVMEYTETIAFLVSEIEKIGRQLISFRFVNHKMRSKNSYSLSRFSKSKYPPSSAGWRTSAGLMVGKFVNKNSVINQRIKNRQLMPADLFILKPADFSMIRLLNCQSVKVYLVFSNIAIQQFNNFFVVKSPFLLKEAQWIQVQGREL